MARSLASRNGLWLAAMAGISLGLASLADGQTCGGPYDGTILELNSDSLTSYVPAAATGLQDLRPHHLHRAVAIDGSLREGFAYGAAIAGDPFGNPASGEHRSPTGVRLDTGTYPAFQVDMSLPSPGFNVTVSRSHGARQQDASSAYFVSDGPQGKNWGNHLFMELVFHDDDATPATLEAEDMAYIVAGPDRYVALRRSGENCESFRATNGAAGVLYEITGEETCGAGTTPELWRYVDQTGKFFDFFGFDVEADPVEGRLWRVTDPAGNVAYFGDSGDPCLARDNGFDVDGRPSEMFDPAGRRYTFTYSSSAIGGAKRLTQILAEEFISSAWTEVGRVGYTYFGGGDTYDGGGTAGDLKTVTVTTPLTDSGVSNKRWTYYRYYTSSDTEPAHTLKYIYDSEGLRQFYPNDANWDAASNLFSSSDVTLKPYASAGFDDYDSDHRLLRGWFNGECGCSGGASGTYEFSYTTNGSYTNGAGYDWSSPTAVWAYKTQVIQPRYIIGGAADDTHAYKTFYFDETGQILGHVVSADRPQDTSDHWPTQMIRNSSGQVTEVRTPANLTWTYNTDSFSADVDDGLIQVYTRVSSGALTGFVEHVKHREGTSGDAFLDSTTEYKSDAEATGYGDTDLVRPFIAKRWSYQDETTSTAPTTGAYGTSYTYTFWTGEAVLMPKTVTIALPAVTTAQNGSNSSNSTVRYLREDGSTAFTKSADGIFNYANQDSKGQVTKRIADAQTNHATDFSAGDDPNGTWGITESSAGLRYVTTMTYDNQGRPDEATAPNGDVSKRYYSKLAGQHYVTIAFPKKSGSTLYGPASYTVSDHAGNAVGQGTIAYSGGSTTAALTALIDETTLDPIAAVDTGALARWRTAIYDETGGKLKASRAYHNIPGTGAGSSPTNYDETLVGYDDRGNRVRSVTPAGTVSRTDYDLLNRPVASHVGTDDTGDPGSPMSGTNNMVQTSATEYDGGGIGNSYVTAVTRDPDGDWNATTDQRVVSYDRDVRGRVVLQTNPVEPKYVAISYYNSGQANEQASFATGSGAPSSPDTTSARLSLSETFIDALGRAYESRTYEIDQSTGAIVAPRSAQQYLANTMWYDEAGRVAQTIGRYVTKSEYDRLGRLTDSYVVLSGTGGSYTDALQVTTDAVLQQRKIVYENDSNANRGRVVMTVTYERNHSDSGTGPLDTNADNDNETITQAGGSPDVAKAFVQIQVRWFDVLGRVTTAATYGDNDDADFDRDSFTDQGGGTSPPSTSSPSVLVTTTSYNDDGSVLQTTDTAGTAMLFEYDDAGRQVTTIQNYVNGTPSGVTADDDIITRTTYDLGRVETVWHDTDGDGTIDAASNPDTDDPVTTYAYGVSSGSQLHSNDLLHTIQDPEANLISYEYNALSERLLMEDGVGNQHAYVYDTAGRLTQDRAASIDPDFDDSVQCIATEYDERGLVETITQWDDPDPDIGAIVNQLGYTYDNWGNLEVVQQDNDSAVGGTSVYTVDHDFNAATLHRFVTKLGTTLSDGSSILYEYLSSDATLGRPTFLHAGGGSTAWYIYAGVQRVVATQHLEPGMRHRLYDANNEYTALDRFGRPTETVWWHTSLSAGRNLVDIDYTYDLRSNIDHFESNFLIDSSGNHVFDVDFDYDTAGRLTEEQRGDWGGAGISTLKQDQEWSLDQRANWQRFQNDLNGDASYTGDDVSEYREHTLANEIEWRDASGTSPIDLDTSADGNGNFRKQVVGASLPDAGDGEQYTYDAWNRLVKIERLDNDAVDYTIAEYGYDGLGRRVWWHEDTDNDMDADGSDPVYNLSLDEMGRIMNVYRGTDADPKERFVYHAAGNPMQAILRDRDFDADWEAAPASGLEDLETRHYYMFDARGNVAAVVTDTGVQVEQPHFTVQGQPFLIPAGDIDKDGDVDDDDVGYVKDWVFAPTYRIDGDIDQDDDVDLDDLTAVDGLQGTIGGYDVLSRSDVESRKGWKGAEASINDAGIYHFVTICYSVVQGRVLQGESLQQPNGTAPAATSDAGGGPCEAERLKAEKAREWLDRFEWLYENADCDNRFTDECDTYKRGIQQSREEYIEAIDAYLECLSTYFDPGSDPDPIPIIDPCTAGLDTTDNYSVPPPLSDWPPSPAMTGNPRQDCLTACGNLRDRMVGWCEECGKNFPGSTDACLERALEKHGECKAFCENTPDRYPEPNIPFIDGVAVE